MVQLESFAVALSESSNSLGSANKDSVMTQSSLSKNDYSVSLLSGSSENLGCHSVVHCFVSFNALPYVCNNKLMSFVVNPFCAFFLIFFKKVLKPLCGGPKTGEKQPIPLIMAGNQI